jgi:hypothetical protein
MKTVKEKAKEYADALCAPENKPVPVTYKEVHEYLDAAFVAGAAFAQRWIPVEEELPEDNRTVLCLLPDGSVRTSFLLSDEYGFAYNISPTHWRPINIK